MRRDIPAKLFKIRRTCSNSSRTLWIVVALLLQIGVPNLLTEKPYAFFEIIRCSRRKIREKGHFFYFLQTKLCRYFYFHEIFLGSRVICSCSNWHLILCIKICESRFKNALLNDECVETGNGPPPSFLIIIFTTCTFIS